MKYWFALCLALQLPLLTTACCPFIKSKKFQDSKDFYTKKELSSRECQNKTNGLLVLRQRLFQGRIYVGFRKLHSFEWFFTVRCEDECSDVKPLKRLTGVAQVCGNLVRSRFFSFCNNALCQTRTYSANDVLDAYNTSCAQKVTLTRPTTQSPDRAFPTIPGPKSTASNSGNKAGNIPGIFTNTTNNEAVSRGTTRRSSLGNTVSNSSTENNSTVITQTSIANVTGTTPGPGNSTTTATGSGSVSNLTTVSEATTRPATESTDAAVPTIPGQNGTATNTGTNTTVNAEGIFTNATNNPTIAPVLRSTTLNVSEVTNPTSTALANATAERTTTGLVTANIPSTDLGGVGNATVVGDITSTVFSGVSELNPTDPPSDGAAGKITNNATNQAINETVGPSTTIIPVTNTETLSIPTAANGSTTGGPDGTVANATPGAGNTTVPETTEAMVNNAATSAPDDKRASTPAENRTATANTNSSTPSLRNSTSSTATSSDASSAGNTVSSPTTTEQAESGNRTADSQRPRLLEETSSISAVPQLGSRSTTTSAETATLLESTSSSTLASATNVTATAGITSINNVSDVEQTVTATVEPPFNITGDFANTNVTVRDVTTERVVLPRDSTISTTVEYTPEYTTAFEEATEATDRPEVAEVGVLTTTAVSPKATLTNSTSGLQKSTVDTSPEGNKTGI